MSRQLKVITRLSEDVIKRAALPFLKQYYKYRPNLMENDLEAGVYFELQYDLEDEKKGVVIDGLISYKQKNGEYFTAALEASSKEKKDEVIFKIQNTLLIWDGLAIGSVIVNFLFIVLFLTKLIDVRAIGGMLIGLTSALLITVFTLIFRWLFSSVYEYVDRYHYIYAVEQFKQYEADEQWIAIGEDVFERQEDGTENVELAELKDQCIKSGFGLLEIRHDLIPTIIITPARKTVIKKRRSLDFTTRSAFAKKIMASDYTKRARRNFFRFLRKSRINELRFTRNYYGQIGILLFSSLIIAAITWQELSKTDVLKQPYEEYVAALNARDYDLWKPEEKNPSDTMDQLFVQPFERLEGNYLNTPKDRPSFTLKQRTRKQDRSKADEFMPIPIVEADTSENQSNKEKLDGFFLLSDGEIIASYPCERVVFTNEVRYIIQYDAHTSQPAAVFQIDSLNQLGIAANIFWTGCLATERDSFIVMFDQFYKEEALANAQLLLSKQSLEAVNLPTNKLRIRTLSIGDNQ